tara:strand:- start:451 stop:633 length:183 start_codon:yes stop_codon:yes gene_type:complete
MKRKRQPNSFISYNEYFTYEKSTWSVIYKLDELVYAVKLGKGGKIGGGVMRFRDGMMVEK